MELPSGRLIVLAMLAAVSLWNDVRAQTTTSGGLSGFVTDRSNAGVPDANVEARDNTKGTAQTTKTDREGVYRFSFLAPATYVLSVTHEGFRQENRTIRVVLGPPVTANVTLEVATASAEVTVIGEAPLVNAENGDASATVSQKQIAEVPNPGNDLTYIAQTSPGVVMNTDMQGLANFSILGMPGTSNLFTVNGMNDNDNGINLNLVGSLNLLLGQNQVQEATVVTTGYSGQFGGAAGANINYITKSGNNEVHGNAVYYWNGRALNANDWILNATGKPRPFDNANQWAASLGGPIKKSKLFFFFDTEGVRLLLPQVQFVTLPSPLFEAASIANIDSDPRFGPASATDTFYRRIFKLYNAAPGASSASPGGFSPATDPTGCTGFQALGPGVPCAVHFVTTRSIPSADTLTSGRVDWNVSRNDRAFLQMQYDQGHVPIAVDPISALFDAVGNQPWWQGEFIETHTFGSSAANQFLLGASYFAPVFRLAHASQALTTFPATLNFAPGTFTTLAGANSGLAFTAGRPTTRYQVSEDFVKTQGNQRFGFGASFERIYWTSYVNTPFEAGALTAQTLDAFYQGGVDPKFLAGTDSNPDYTQLGKSFSAALFQRITFYTLGLYGQDEWHARPNLTFTFGLRAEHQSNPWCARGCFARMNGPFESVSHNPGQPYNQTILINQKQALPGIDNILWSPRISFAWQPLGVSHGILIRGGIGLLYDPLPANLALTLSSNPPLLSSYTVFGDNLTPNESTSLFKDAAGSNTAFLNGFASGQTLAQIQATISGFYPPGFSPPAISAPEKRTHSPQYQRWSLELERAFGGGSSLSIGYFGHHGIHELVLNNSANAFCNPAAGSAVSNPCFEFTSSLPLAVPDSRFSEVTSITSAAVSNYNGMVISFRHRFSHGLLQANYTYGHAFDEVSNGG
ncbi:MAG TPA: carboxypeptidase regulatory-like domain-containing protein, partial [Candidatus Sulfotelmatobacter sp.]|nr:carboxypeptidase regulatory-like domain-containing protein [Candidatus Sulfotelmatobacter sp.]